MVNSLKILPCRYHAALFAVLAITRPRLQNIVDIFRLITITIQKHFPESKSVLDSGKYFGFLQVFLDSRKYFVFLELFLDSGKCFGFWEVFLNSRKCFGFWDVFWILGRLLFLDEPP